MKNTVMLKILILLTIITGCQKIPTMSQEVINAVDVEELSLFYQDPENKQPPKVYSDFFYGNNSLYLSDKKNNRIIALDEDNKVFLEIGGNFQETPSNQSEKFWEKELNTFLSQVEDPESISKKKKVRLSPRKKVKERYEFKQIDKIIADQDENIYVIDNTNEGMAVLKFSPEGKFLYRIGKEGRDNPYFEKDVAVIDMSLTKDNGLWLKYISNGVLSIRFYNNFGKNILYFEEKQIQEAINAFLEKGENEYYRIEDIFPFYDSNKISVVVNLYKKDEGRYQIKTKRFFKLNQSYNVEDYWEFKDTNLQIFNINNNNDILCFSYFTKEKTPIFKLYNYKGKLILEKKISLQRFNYNRISVTLTQNGDLMGAFLKKNILYFVIWK